MKKELAIAATIILALMSALMIVEVAVANPLTPSLIAVNSPQNNRIYPSNTVQLHFSVLPNTWFNFTSFTYILDNQPPVATNGTTILTNLPAGSHTLTIYGRGTTSSGGTYYEHQDMLVAIVYFSTEYSTTWITFTIITLAAVTIIPLLLFLKRRQIAAKLKDKKNGAFWLGTALLVFGALVFVPFTWQAANDYLFPYWPRWMPLSPPSWLMIIGALIFMATGLYMMMLGTQKAK